MILFISIGEFCIHTHIAMAIQLHDVAVQCDIPIYFGLPQDYPSVLSMKQHASVSCASGVNRGNKFVKDKTKSIVAAQKCEPETFRISGNLPS